MNDNNYKGEGRQINLDGGTFHEASSTYNNYGGVNVRPGTQVGDIHYQDNRQHGAGLSGTSHSVMSVAQSSPRVQVPSVGRIVHYRAYGTPGGEYPAGVLRAAIITEVEEPGNPTSVVGLMVINPTGEFFNRHVAYDPELPGHWCWPAYVESVKVASN